MFSSIYTLYSNYSLVIAIFISFQIYTEYIWSCVLCISCIFTNYTECIKSCVLFIGVTSIYRYIQNGRVIQERQFTVGDFILFCTYLLQLYGPLNFFGVHYR